MFQSKIARSAFVFALAAAMTAGMIHLSASPAEAVGLNCNFYSRPGCDWVGWIDGCCYFEGSNCRGGRGYVIGPCQQIF